MLNFVNRSKKGLVKVSRGVNLLWRLECNSFLITILKRVERKDYTYPSIRITYQFPTNISFDNFAPWNKSRPCIKTNDLFYLIQALHSLRIVIVTFQLVKLNLKMHKGDVEGRVIKLLKNIFLLIPKNI